MSTRDELRKVQSLRGDTYSSAEVIGLIGRAADEIERLRALLKEVRDDINDYGFADSFADETHKTLAKIDIALGSNVEQTEDRKP